MHQLNVYLVNAFTEQGAGGNPAGVVLQADGLTDEQKLAIAQSVGFSETAFVSAASDADFTVTFFTPATEVDFCGHATVAAFSVMLEQGLITQGHYVQSTKAGQLGVTIEPDGHIVMAQNLPQYLKRFDYAEISALIGLDTSILASTQLPIEAISTGLADIIVPVPSGHLDKLKVNDKALSNFSRQHNVIGLHAFELCDEGETFTARCRNFAPLFAIPEESATGSACGALACYLTKYVYPSQSNHFTFEQGRVMGCPSRITASVESNGLRVSKVLVGGKAQITGTSALSI
ncbi:MULTISPECIES: PhzF family phenazine biosynthesis protein [unclassified Pseudoalteromonas]|uniref:PhzF family phenazine biosynthesis protein n=1 Tax=unclassified Pseudoalteromonas TaxID=194690 RepID=UPI002098168E|nr:PhzF family phenazine biosynthesis protein [Pseudoalteromonas sp. XMcav2-N]MCO7188893.1 PhzF family phenazine biosynthesis protein [Pseudoalteromonas sp. XMcav2-N]